MGIRKTALLAATILAAACSGPAYVSGADRGWADRCRENVDNSINQEFWIYFNTSGTDLDAEAMRRIKRADGLGKARDVEQICIAAQASKEGDARANRELSYGRAEAVARAFMQRGWRRDQIAIVAKGEAWGFMSDWLSGDAAPDRRVVVTFSY